MVCRPHNKPHGVNNLQGSRPDFTAGLLKDSSFQSDFMPDEMDDRIKLQSTDKLVSSHCHHSEFGRWAVKANEITQDIRIKDFYYFVWLFNQPFHLCVYLSVVCKLCAGIYAMYSNFCNVLLERSWKVRGDVTM